MTSAQSETPGREELLALARATALLAHAPYSRFRVGAVVVADGQLYRGVNVEISSYGLTLCAERAALAAALSAGARTISHLAVACIDASPTAPAAARTPCGACRQWLADLAPQAIIYIDGLAESLTVPDLLPYAFVL
ncbi:cytidine deaminase [Thermogemmatispora sp.]|uniref:cytidine deaminase n=1 Tax=Thermogemmatispora sp. TaxID=1968838 RepID=UPI0035E446A8